MLTGTSLQLSVVEATNTHYTQAVSADPLAALEAALAQSTFLSTTLAEIAADPQLCRSDGVFSTLTGSAVEQLLKQQNSSAFAAGEVTTLLAASMNPDTSGASLLASAVTPEQELSARIKLLFDQLQGSSLATLADPANSQTLITSLGAPLASAVQAVVSDSSSPAAISASASARVNLSQLFNSANTTLQLLIANTPFTSPIVVGGNSYATPRALVPYLATADAAGLASVQAQRPDLSDELLACLQRLNAFLEAATANSATAQQLTDMLSAMQQTLDGILTASLNRAPNVANAQYRALTIAAAVTFDPLLGVVDSDGVTLDEAQMATLSPHGTIAIDPATRAITYTPEVGYLECRQLCCGGG